ncbi:MAG: hypothetical protein HC888_05090 [Candidatus Competibacteraceae bacterium]|nr:hypothetical protein [Candidatus Competibacteraceae bacterium]
MTIPQRRKLTPAEEHLAWEERLQAEVMERAWPNRKKETAERLQRLQLLRQAHAQATLIAQGPKRIGAVNSWRGNKGYPVHIEWQRSFPWVRVGLLCVECGHRWRLRVPRDMWVCCARCGNQQRLVRNGGQRRV